MRALLPLALSLLLVSSAGAQVKLGVAGGVNFGDLSDVRNAAQTTSLENSTGYHAGVYADVSALLLSFRTGVYYLESGDVRRGGETLSARFIMVPVDLRLKTPTPVLKVYALAGPELRFPIGESITDVETRSLNVGAAIGVGAEFGIPIAGPNGFVELRYSRDFTGFAEDRGLSTDNQYELNLVMVRAGIGL